MLQEQTLIKSVCLLSPVSLWALRLCAPGFPAQHDITHWLSSERKWSKCNEIHWLTIRIILQIDTNWYKLQVCNENNWHACSFSFLDELNWSFKFFTRSWTFLSSWKYLKGVSHITAFHTSDYVVRVSTWFNLTPWTSMDDTVLIFAEMEIEGRWTAEALQSRKVMWLDFCWLLWTGG